jgi:hypothetical protein
MTDQKADDRNPDNCARQGRQTDPQPAKELAAIEQAL